MRQNQVRAVLFVLLEISLSYNTVQEEKRNKNDKLRDLLRSASKQKIEEEEGEWKENLDNIVPLKPKEERCFRGTGAKQLEWRFNLRAWKARTLWGYFCSRQAATCISWVWVLPGPRATAAGRAGCRQPQHLCSQEKTRSIADLHVGFPYIIFGASACSIPEADLLCSGQAREVLVSKRDLFPSQGLFHSLLPSSGRPLHLPNLLPSKKFSVPTSPSQWGLSCLLIAGLSPVFCLLSYLGLLFLVIFPCPWQKALLALSRVFSALNHFSAAS